MNDEQEQNQQFAPEEQTAYPQERKAEKKDNLEERTHEGGLSLQQREKLKKMIIFTILGIVFVLSLWWIFTPSAEEKKEAEQQIGLNDAVPQASNPDLPDDKLKAYNLGTDEEKESQQQGKLGSLYDYFDRESEKQRVLAEAGTVNDDPVAESVNQYQQTTRMLQSFNEPPAYDPEKEEMWNEIDRLHAQLAEMEEAKDSEADHLELMEKSYQLAAKYLPQSQETKANPFETAIERDMDEPVNAHETAQPKEKTLTVYPEVDIVATSLYQEVSDSVFLAEQMQERNRSFLSATDAADYIPDKNTLKAAVYETVTVKDGETVRLRLLESARVANMVIPKNNLLTAVAKIQGNRLTLTVTNIEYKERILAVNLSAYDTDGQLGVFVPNSEEMNAVKEVVAGMGQSTGTSFTFNSSAGQQLAADAGKGIMQGASQYLNKKMREVKVTLKSGHKLFLMQNK